MATTSGAEKHDDYWKIQRFEGYSIKAMRQMLEERKHGIGALSKGAALRECLRRSELGLQSYYELDNDQLRLLLRKRGISTISGGSRSELLDELNEADLHPKFHRFLDLPPELRNRVYEYHLESFKQPIYIPSQPPITKTCKLLRGEVLPMFYATSTFELRFYRPYRTRCAGYMNRITMSDRLLLFIRSTHSDNLARIQKLRIRVAEKDSLGRHAISSLDSYLACHVDLTCSAHAVKFD